MTDFWTAAAEAHDRDREVRRLRGLVRVLTVSLDRRLIGVDRGDLMLPVDRELLARAKREAFADPEAVAPALISTQAADPAYRP